MSVRLSPNLPANVVEIGNEISQAKINEINAGTLALQTYVTSRGYLTDAPSNGSEYVRKNGAWSVATGGGGGGSVAWGAITGTVTNQTDLTLYVTGLGYQTASDVSTYVTGLGYQTSSDVSTYVTGLGYQTASDVSTYATANFYPLSTNPAGYLTSAPAKTVNTLTGTYTLDLTDANNIIYADMSTGGGMPYNIYVPDDGTTNFPIGTVITFINNASSGSDATLTTVYMGTPALIGTTYYSGGSTGQAFLTKVASNTWVIK